MSEAIAIVALILNVLVWPGLGTLVAGRINTGLAQGFLFLGGIFVTFLLAIILIGFVIGPLMMLGAWIWGLVTGIQLVQQVNAQKQVAPRAGSPPTWQQRPGAP